MFIYMILLVYYMSIYLHRHINTCCYGHECACRCVLCRSREVWKFVQQSRRNVYLLEIILFHFKYKINKSNLTLWLVAELGGTQGTQKYKGRWNWENLFQHFLSCQVIMHWSCPSMKGHCTKQAASPLCTNPFLGSGTPSVLLFGA